MIPSPNEDREGEDLLPLSALNDLLYCDRRCWLHRVAGLDSDNAHTLSGQFDHARADEPETESRPGVRIERAVPILSRSLGLIGRTDVIEFHTIDRSTPVGAAESVLFKVSPAPPGSAAVEWLYPVEHKHGPRRKWDNDDVQLCAQAICLEEMLGASISAGAIYHVRTRRRREVQFTPDLRRLVSESAAELHRLMRDILPPPARLKPQCDGCAMRGHCLPEAGSSAQRIQVHLEELFKPGDGP